jgi:hypothetical protein
MTLWRKLRCSRAAYSGAPHARQANPFGGRTERRNHLIDVSSMVMLRSARREVLL